MSTNPNLLKENQKILSDIVGREISQEGIYLPIESKKLFDQLNQIDCSTAVVNLVKYDT